MPASDKLAFFFNIVTKNMNWHTFRLNKTNYLFNKLYNKSNKYDVMRYKYIRYSGYHLLEKDDFKQT